MNYEIGPQRKDNVEIDNKFLDFLSSSFVPFDH